MKGLFLSRDLLGFIWIGLIFIILGSIYGMHYTFKRITHIVSATIFAISSIAFLGIGYYMIFIL